MAKCIIKGTGNFYSSKYIKWSYRTTKENLVIKDFSDWNEKKFNNIAMIAGGTGITPLLQVYFILLFDIIW